MTDSKSKQLTRSILGHYQIRAYDGDLTVEDVVSLVKGMFPHASREAIINAIEEFGPIGENDHVWLHQPVPKPSRWYLPHRPRRKEHEN